MPRILLALLTLALVCANGTGALAKEAKRAVTVTPLEARQMLLEDPRATFLMDVRNRFEYALLGHPPQAYNVPWRFATTDFQVAGGPYQGGKAAATGYQPSPKPNPDFLGVAQSLFKPGDRVIVISTDGEDGADAADALTQGGFKQVYNIRHGFWGEPLVGKDQDRLAEKLSPYHGQRGRVNGWVFWGLPVEHHLDPRYVYPPDLKRMQEFR